MLAPLHFRRQTAETANFCFPSSNQPTSDGLSCKTPANFISRCKKVRSSLLFWRSVKILFHTTSIFSSNWAIEIPYNFSNWQQENFFIKFKKLFPAFSGLIKCNHGQTGDWGKISWKSARGAHPVIWIVVAQPHELLWSRTPLPPLPPRQLPPNCRTAGYSGTLKGTLKSVLTPDWGLWLERNWWQIENFLSGREVKDLQPACVATLDRQSHPTNQFGKFYSASLEENLEHQKIFRL